MIVLQFDRRYHHWALLLLHSLELHEREHRVLCDTVGLEPEHILELERAHERVICRNSAMSEVVTPTAMANRKPFVLQSAIDRFVDEPWFCLLDADMLVRRPLDDLWELVDDAPAALVLTNGMWEGHFYPRLVTVSSVVLVRPIGRELVDRWAQWYGHGTAVDSIEPGMWFWDQVTLFLAWTEKAQGVASISLPLFANDSLDQDAAIWAANVPDKDAYFLRFQAEHARQRSLLTR
jgi:hypothetical protein